MDIKELAEKSYINAQSHGFWEDEHDIVSKMILLQKFNQREIQAVKLAFMCQRMMMIVTEVSEAVGALRVGNRKNYEEELTDILLRLANTLQGDKINIEKELIDKMEINQNRPYKHGNLF